MEASVLLTMTRDLVKAQIDAGELTPDRMQTVLQETHATLITLQTRQDQAGEAEGTDRPPRLIDWRQSITQHAITCMECGAVSKQLSRRHLHEHNLTARQYRSKHGIPKELPLASRRTTARRRQAVQETRPWEKAPKFMQAQK